MQSTAADVMAYLAELPEDRRTVVNQLREVILENLSPEFTEIMNYGMIGYVIPHSVYPAGYHCDPKLPLPFMGLASQKNSVNFYHMGVYADEALLDWFVTEYPKHAKSKLDMGKSCVRFKKMDDVPYQLVGQLTHKMDASAWIELYETNLKPKK
jgi:uncharacterized protein YdhG (YjbR/CyaY superfamily)